MKQKLVEEWLTRAGERGGIDHAVAQWLISEGHEILWLGHSRTEFGKDIVSKDKDGKFHAYQTKDEDIDLKALRGMRDQINELVEVPIVHPRVPSGSSHVSHLVTSGIIKEEAALQIRALNEGWATRGLGGVEPSSRLELIPRFVGMSDAFWPETPSDIRDFFAFYLAEGRGDFDPRKFSSMLKKLFPLNDESGSKKARRLAAVGLLGNYLLNPFEREGDHWSLFRGWTLIAAHQAWFAERSGLAEKTWRGCFDVAKDAAKHEIMALYDEASDARSLIPQELEFDDYTRTRNLVIAGAVALADRFGRNAERGSNENFGSRLETLLRKNRFFLWGESAVSNLLLIQWYSESHSLSIDALPMIELVIAELCERNHHRSEDEYFPPPTVSADEVLEQLFNPEPRKERNRRCPGTWSLQSLLGFLARRNRRPFLDSNWRKISHLDMMSFQPDRAIDMLLWECSEGRESMRKPEREQSWAKLLSDSHEDRTAILPTVLIQNPDFALMFMLVYPHRLSPALVEFLDREYAKSSNS
jgi:hypothetical protein